MKLLNNLFSGKKLKEPIDLSPLKTDMHSHLIPGIDDGVQTIEESVDLITKLQRHGFKKLIITPHIQADYYKNTHEIIFNGLQEVSKAVRKAGISIQLEAAAEYMIDDGFEEKLKSGKLMTLGDNYVLVELSYYDPHPNFSQLLFELQLEGFKIILAHPERYTYWFNDFKKYEELKDRNIFLQLNTISLSGYYTLPVKKMAEKLIDNNMIDFLGTDMHNQTYMQGLEKSLVEKYLDKILSSGKLLNDSL